MFLTEYNTRCYGVTFQNNGCNKVQKIKDILNDDNNILYIKISETFLGKVKVCDMFEKSIFDGKTIVLKINDENDKHKYVYVGGDMINSFRTIDNVSKNISNMRNTLTPYSIAVGHENIFLSPLVKFIKNDRIDDSE